MAAETFKIGCFGKLPFYPEYIDRGAGLPTARALRKWLHDGKETVAGIEGSEGFGKDVPIQARLRMMIGLPGSPELLVGVLRQSKDHGGRNFPFAVFTYLSRRAFGRKYAMLPLGLAPVWETLDHTWQSLAGVASKSGFDEVFEELEVTQPSATAEVIEEYKLGLDQTMEALDGRSDGASEMLLREQFPELLARLKRGGTDGLSVALPIRRGSVEACFDTSFWMDLINRQFLLKRFEPSAMLDDAQPRGAATVFLRFGELDAEDYPAVMGCHDPDSPLTRPAHPSDGEAGHESSEEPPTYAELLASRLS